MLDVNLTSCDNRENNRFHSIDKFFESIRCVELQIIGKQMDQGKIFFKYCTIKEGATRSALFV